MWEKRSGFTPHAEVLLPFDVVSQWTIPEKKQKGRGVLGTYFFKKTLEFLGFALYPLVFLTK